MSKKAIIIGAGPAGLTAAYELLKRTDIIPIILEKSGDIGGISKTVNYKGNRMDIGGHRFFSKSDRVMEWWLNMMPLPEEQQEQFTISYQQKSRNIKGNTDQSSKTAKDPDKVMLIRQRLSRIYFLRKFFTYPIQLSIDTLTKLGVLRTISILVSYLLAQLFPRKPEKNLEDFMINRFGKTLYKLFFKDYTEKVWGISCQAISAEWGAQRIKGVSISKAIRHAIQSATAKKKNNGDLAQKGTETSLIEQFLYPKFGPGQLWEEVARQITEMGGEIRMWQDVKRIYTATDSAHITAIATVDQRTGDTSYLEGDYFFSTMPVQELIGGMDGSIPDDVRHVASGLQYRDFITVGILLKQLSFQDKKTGEWRPLELKDTWIYIQEKDVTVGRLQVFNNWSPYMVKDPTTTWIGMEFFTNVDEPFWKKSDDEIKQLAIQELEKIGLASSANVLDSTVLRVEKTYPAYFGTYERFHVIQAFTDKFKNLFLVGRNGMHKYNNSDHSMLTAMVAVDNIVEGVTSKENIWSINTEQEYHEVKKDENVKGKAATDERQPLPNVQVWNNLLHYIFKDPQYRWFVRIGIAGVILLFALFKWLYPYASFINGDSYVYLETAYHNFDINTYPIGYSRFLRLFSVFTKSDTALVGFQYLFLQVGVWGLIFTLFNFYRPAKLTKILLFAFLVFNPVLLYLANYVSSDAFFLAISLVWLTQLIWIIHKPSWQLLISNALLLFIAFTVRYNALCYPLIAVAFFFLSRKMWPIKLASLALSGILIFSFMQFTSNKYYELSGKRQFSPFTGWQLANNAMYAYRYVDSAAVKPVPARFKKLDRMIRTYFDTTRDVKKHPQEMVKASTVYMWDPISPLQKYKEGLFNNDSTIGRIKKWATTAPLYNQYGSYLIRTYPVEFAEYYLVPNALKYYAPPVEFLEEYNMGVDSVQFIAKTWFNYKSSKVKVYSKNLSGYVLGLYPVLVGMLNVVFLLGAFSFYMLNGGKKRPVLNKAILAVSALWLINFGFSVFASPIALRFQLFPILVFLSFDFLLVEYMIREARGSTLKNIYPELESIAMPVNKLTAS